MAKNTMQSAWNNKKKENTRLQKVLAKKKAGNTAPETKAETGTENAEAEPK